MIYDYYKSLLIIEANLITNGDYWAMSLQAVREEISRVLFNVDAASLRR